ncbi:MAG: pirin family protein [Proteobacteria bacterium]|nr:pirin family protein [Pseudomonadota bacterium]MDA1290245.1 pirin family protein [Pseudomonadota bacterium]
MNKQHKLRELEEVLIAQSTSDGDGVQLKRVFGGSDLARFDPFLMLDEFGSDKAADYIGGFPSHPHRGFETVTYMLAGQMEHRDHMGNVGSLGPGDVQWMKAGSGVIHSEMPKQEEGKMHGFQLWVNLPAREKMTPASYNDIDANSIPSYQLNGVAIKSIAGELEVNGEKVSGVVIGLSTDPSYLDVSFSSDQQVDINVPDGYTALVYVYAGFAVIGDSNYQLSQGKLARLSRDGRLLLSGGSETKLLVITGRPIGEPIAHRGPFVMNTMDEIHQAIRDYSDGTLV